jgi:hypothetical protein
MTHDELLAKINNFTCCSGAHELALRAVVELHKPIEPVEPVESHDYYWYGLCDDCLKTYPCPTIQAIEKVLL